MKIRFALFCWLTVLHGKPVDGQGTEAALAISSDCARLNHDARSLVEQGRTVEAERMLSTALATGDDRRFGCAGLVMNDMAALLLISGRLNEAEVLAECSVSTLEKIYPPDDPMLLRPLYTLAGVHFELGETARARQTLKRIQSLRLDRLEDRALVDGMAASMSEAEGNWRESESHYSDAIRALQQAGRGETADAGALLNGIGAVYIKDHRLTEARQALDRALAIFENARDVVPWDRIKLLYTSGVLRTLQQQWQQAQNEFAEALSLADHQPGVESHILLHLLIDYAQVLRRNHQRREARSIQARIAVLRSAQGHSQIVDVADLAARARTHR